MQPLIGRLFVLLLLAIDWAADPSQVAPAVQSLAAPLASTENFCPSLGYREAIHQEHGHIPVVPCAGGLVSTTTPGPGTPPSLGEALPLPAGADLIYVLMSIRR